MTTHAEAPAAPQGPGPLPACFEYLAPAGWERIDFISDLHLCEAMPNTFKTWAGHLRNTPADAVFMLGDLFEVWVGDDMRNQPFERRCVEVMAEAASHRQLAFMVGNRDFLVGSSMLRDSGVLALPDPTLLNAWGHCILLSHGDALCLSDTPYQSFRQQVRSSVWQAEFLGRPLNQRLQIAGEIRRASTARHCALDDLLQLDIDASEAVHWMHAMGAAELVHGHTHRPGSALLAPGFKRHVLSDWDMDTAQRAEVLRLGRGGFVRIAPSSNQ